jgi:putative aldouronate transport system substrate-binding protein
MKLRKILCLLVTAVMFTGLLAGCISDDGDSSVQRNDGNLGNFGDINLDEVPDELNITGDEKQAILEELGLEKVGDFYRFKETRTIKVQLFDRTRDDGRTDPANCYWTKWLQFSALRDLNINVEYQIFPRWGEENEISVTLASGSAPDIMYTYNYDAIQIYAEDMSGILDMDPFVTDLAFLAPNLWELLGPELIYFNRNPITGTIWAIEGIIQSSVRINTFVREDWLARIDFPEPTNAAEFEAMLYAFRDSAELLLGADADKIIPLSVGADVGWRADHLLASFVPNSFTDKERYIYGYDDRMFLFPGIKEGVRLLNTWYNAGLMWSDFHLYGGRGDTTEDSLKKSGVVGSFISNWDLPYRGDANGVQGMMRQALNDESAGYKAIGAFQNDEGLYKKFMPANNDRKICFPHTNSEPEASLIYLDYISSEYVRSYLGTGVENINFEFVRDGDGEVIAVRKLDPTVEALRDNIFESAPGIINDRTGTNVWTWAELIVNSPQNIDYLMTFNTNSNLWFQNDAIAAASQAYSFPEATEEQIRRAFHFTTLDARMGINVQAGRIEAETIVGGRHLNDKRDTTLVSAVRAAPGDFDRVFDSGMADYLASGGQEIIDERMAAWVAMYGDIVNLVERN